MKLILASVIVMATIYNSYAQKILNRKEVAKKLIQIENEINNKNFEKALNIFQNENEVILEKKVRKRDLEKYNDILSILYEKNEIMTENRNKVDKYIKDYKNNKLCDATLLLDLHLTKENSFVESQKKYNEYKSKLILIRPICVENSNKVLSCVKDYDNLKYCEVTRCTQLKVNPQNAYTTTISTFNVLLPKIQEAKRRCSDYANKIKKWQTEYNNKEFDKLFFILNGINEQEKVFIPLKYRKQFEILLKNINDKEEELQTFKKEYVNPIKTKIEEINGQSLTYIKAQNDIRSLSALMAKLDTAMKRKYINFPSLILEAKNLTKQATSVITRLKIFYQKNKPQNIDLAQLYSDFAGEGIFDDSKYTDIQKKYLWNKNYKGKTIIGHGTIYDINERVFNLGAYITIQVTSSNYVDLYVVPSEEKELLNLNK